LQMRRGRAEPARFLPHALRPHGGDAGALRRGLPGRGDPAGVTRTSAGILLYRRNRGVLEVLLVHPGGPFFGKKDLGNWSIPKGEVDREDPDYEQTAIQFAATRRLTEMPPPEVRSFSFGPPPLIGPRSSVFDGLPVMVTITSELTRPPEHSAPAFAGVPQA